MSKTMFGSNIGHLRLDTYVLANIVQLGTQHFCKEFLKFENDPKGRQYDQMTQAARSVVANIAEGSARHFTSTETEMKLTDVARASLAELAADYTNWLMQKKRAPWRKDTPEARAILETLLDEATRDDLDPIHASCCHILRQQEKFSQWLESRDEEIAANALLILCGRLGNMLNKQLESQGARFKAEGGFREKLYTTRSEVRTRAENAPACPECSKPMRKQRRKSDSSEFWGCTGYPECRTTQPIKSSMDSRDSRGSMKSSLINDSNSSNISNPSNHSTSPSDPSEIPTCPECSKPMVQRKSARGSFWGCTGFRDGCKATRPISDQQTPFPSSGSSGVHAASTEAPTCPDCSKPMVQRRSARGFFWGCTGFRDGCKATRPISDQQVPPSSSSSSGVHAVSAETPTCPDCGKPMVQRTSARGSFWGCTGFPEGCKATRQISHHQQTSIESMNSNESINSNPSTPSNSSNPSKLFNPLIF